MKKLLVVLLVLVFAAPAMAADWNFYGSARMGLWYTTYDEDASNVGEDGQDADGNPIGDTESDTDLDYYLQGNSRVGAKVKTSDVVSGRFEYGTGVNVRLLYGEAKFGGLTFLAGQGYTPINTLYSNQVYAADTDLLDCGMIFERQPMLQISIAGFKAALLVNDQDNVNGQNDVMLPKIELSYDMKMSAFSIGGYLGYQTYDEGDNAGETQSVDAYVLGVRSKINMGPAYVNVNLAMAQNPGDYNGSLHSVNSFATAHDGEEDATQIRAALVVGAKVASAVQLEGGVGMLLNERSTEAGADEEGDAMTYYVQAVITLAKGVFIVPEVTIVDLGENDTDGTAVENGQITAFGAKFQINF